MLILRNLINCAPGCKQNKGVAEAALNFINQRNEPQHEKYMKRLLENSKMRGFSMEGAYGFSAIHFFIISRLVIHFTAVLELGSLLILINIQLS